VKKVTITDTNRIAAIISCVPSNRALRATANHCQVAAWKTCLPCRHQSLRQVLFEQQLHAAASNRTSCDSRLAA
jgi:hypothetical protein